MTVMWCKEYPFCVSTTPPLIGLADLFFPTVSYLFPWSQWSWWWLSEMYFPLLFIIFPDCFSGSGIFLAASLFQQRQTSFVDHDLYIIGAVCLSQKSLFPYSKDLVVSHVYSYIPYSKELVVSMFLDTFVVKRFGLFFCFQCLSRKCLLSVFKRFGRFSRL